MREYLIPTYIILVLLHLMKHRQVLMLHFYNSAVAKFSDRPVLIYL